MSENHSDEQINRRKFLKAAAVTAVAATATGAGASLLNSQKTQTQPPLTQPISSTPLSQTGASADLITQMAALQAENARLQADLELATYRLESQETAVTETDTAVQAMSVELDAANQKIGAMAGLVALYEQLDDVDMATLLQEGLETVSDAISEAVDDLPSLSEGIELGREVLDKLDDHIPLLENGRSWLETQTDKMQRYYTAVEALLETAVDEIGPFLQMFNEWVQKILKWLPFNLGERTSTIMDALTDLLLETPPTLTGLHANVAQPLDVWLSGSDDQVPLRQNLIVPMQEQVLAKANSMVTKTAQVQTVYEEKMVRRVTTAVAARDQIKTLIQTYRQQHQI
jgi:hypothetical protein